MCIKSVNLVCSSSKSYLIKVEPDCIDRVVEFLEKNGEITAKFGPLVKGVYRDVPVTIVKPDRMQVMLAYSELEINELVGELKKFLGED